MRLWRAGGVIKPWRVRRDAPGTWEVQSVPQEVVGKPTLIGKRTKTDWKSDQLIVVLTGNQIQNEGADSYTGL